MSRSLLTILARAGDKNATLDTILAEHDRKLFELDDLVEPVGDALPRHTFTSSLPREELSIAALSLRQRLRMMPTMLRLMRSMGVSANFYRARFEARQRRADPALLSSIEASAEAHGASALRYVRLPDDCIFKGLGAPHRNAIVYTVRMSKEALDTAPSFEAFLEVARGYLRLAQIGNVLTRQLRAAGHAAYPGTALGGLTDYSRLAELAGLGTIGYHGLLITPHDGALLRINTIYTSIDNLPFAEAEPNDWVRDFCARCGKCVRQCPPKAIYERPKVRANGRVQCIDADACLDYFAGHHGCAICIDVCPFSQKGYAAIEARFKGNPEAPKYSARRSLPILGQSS